MTELNCTETTEPFPGRATITVEEAGRFLGIGRSAAYDAARRGQIPSLRLGRRVLVPVPRLLQLIGEDPSSQSSSVIFPVP